MYHNGKTIEDKKEADRVFLNNMLRLVDGKTKWRFVRRLRRRRARIYFEAVKRLHSHLLPGGYGKPKPFAFIWGSKRTILDYLVLERGRPELLAKVIAAMRKYWEALQDNENTIIKHSNIKFKFKILNNFRSFGIHSIGNYL